MYWLHSRRCFIAPGATGRRGVANTVVRWKTLGRMNACPR